MEMGNDCKIWKEQVINASFYSFKVGWSDIAKNIINKFTIYLF